MRLRPLMLNESCVLKHSLQDHFLLHWQSESTLQTLPPLSKLYAHQSVLSKNTLGITPNLHLFKLRLGLDWFHSILCFISASSLVYYKTAIFLGIAVAVLVDGLNWSFLVFIPVDVQAQGSWPSSPQNVSPLPQSSHHHSYSHTIGKNRCITAFSPSQFIKSFKGNRRAIRLLEHFKICPLLQHISREKKNDLGRGCHLLHLLM